MCGQIRPRFILSSETYVNSKGEKPSTEKISLSSPLTPPPLSLFSLPFPHPPSPPPLPPHLSLSLFDHHAPQIYAQASQSSALRHT